MVEHSKRKKFHDKDKYYRLAKEQGLRSRAAFKLTQINRAFSVLEKAQNAVLDLCAAPGGWTQVCARTCPKTCQIIAVDILPVRALPGNNITTIVGDITTDKCRAEINRALRGLPTVDVVLHDGAPNIGADFSKDAYEQNELSVHALKCATQHLQRGGTFITKIYRSRDYASYHYVLLQLFDKVTAYKPKASRQQSAEIFLVAQSYKAPSKLDPRFLDPKYVFAQVEGETTGGTMAERGKDSGMTIFHKNWDKKTRKRGGYDMEMLDATMRHIEPTSDFVNTGFKDAVQMLSRSTGLGFSCEACRDGNKDDQDNEEEAPSPCPCRFLAHHPLTTYEIKESLSDLQVLNKSDFKTILTWRSKMQDALQAMQEHEGTKDKQPEEGSDKAGRADGGDASDSDTEKEEEEIQAEIEQMRQRRQRERKRQKKKERVLAQKRRQRAALGTAIDLIDNDDSQVFRLATIQSKGQLDAAAEVNLDEVTDDVLFGHSEDEVVVGGEGDDDSSSGDDDDGARFRRREKELDEAYNQYLSTTKNGLAKSGTKMAKRSKKHMRQKVAEEAAEDQEMALAAPSGVGNDTKAYIEMLQGPKYDDSDDDVDEDDDGDDGDGYDADPMTPEEYAEIRRAKKKQMTSTRDNTNPLIHRGEEEPASAKAARWFSNPLFARIGEAVAQSAASGVKDNKKKGVAPVGGDGGDSGATSDSDTGSDVRSGKKASRNNKTGISADEVLASIPRTDKQIRHERRQKQKAREERRKAKRAQGGGGGLGGEDLGADFELAPAADKEHEDEKNNDISHLSEAQQKKLREARELIKAGIGKGIEREDADAKNKGIEIVPQSDGRPLPVMDERKYDSDHEDYDSDDYARTLALGTMMLRRSKEKALVDASYNRYAWNDPEDLPEWFVDDETRHYRPQLPIPPALIAKMKAKMVALSEKPIAKVAEARARKGKRAKAKLVAAKKKAEAVANSSDMSEASKLKAISKALRGQEARKPNKTYVVAKKGRGMKAGGKGVQVVDKRLKSDKRAIDHLEKKRKKGKQNSLVGSKKRRHHR